LITVDEWKNGPSIATVGLFSHKPAFAHSTPSILYNTRLQTTPQEKSARSATMQSTKPPTPPPGLPSVSQRLSAIQMAARSHSDSFESKSNKKPPPVGGQAMILPQQSTKMNKKVASVPLVIFVDEGDDDRIIKVSKRPRFMRWKNSDKYPCKKADV
jgi:hypothetical protein